MVKWGYIICLGVGLISCENSEIESKTNSKTKEISDSIVSNQEEEIIVPENSLVESKTIIVSGTGMPIEIGVFEDVHVNNIEDFEGVYHYGESNGESSFHLFADSNLLVGQLHIGQEYFDSDGEFLGWRPYYENVTLELQGSNLKGKGCSGKFIVHVNGNERDTGIVFYNDPFSRVMPNEFGWMTYSDNNWSKYFPGKYSETKYKLLTSQDVSGYSKMDLVIARNEIFARYAYEFEEGGEMKAYFNAQKWYEAHYENVSDFLTEIELKNVNFLLQMEKSSLD